MVKVVNVVGSRYMHGAQSDGWGLKLIILLVLHSFLPVLLGKLGVIMVWGYTKVTLHALFLASYYREHKSAEVHCFLPVGKTRVQRYTVSCLLVNWEGSLGVQGYTISFQIRESISVGIHSFLPVVMGCLSLLYEIPTSH